MKKLSWILLSTGIALIIISILIGKFYDKFIGLNIILISIGILISAFHINSENYYISKKVIIPALLILLFVSAFILLEINWSNPTYIILTLIAQLASIIFIVYWAGLFLKSTNIILRWIQFKPDLSPSLIIYLIGFIICFISSFFPIAILNLGMSLRLTPMSDNPYGATLGTGFFLFAVIGSGATLKMTIMNKPINISQIIKSTVLIIIPLVIIIILYFIVLDLIISTSFYLFIAIICIIVAGKFVDLKFGKNKGKSENIE